MRNIKSACQLLDLSVAVTVLTHIVDWLTDRCQTKLFFFFFSNKKHSTVSHHKHSREWNKTVSYHLVEKVAYVDACKSERKHLSKLR